MQWHDGFRHWMSVTSNNRSPRWNHFCAKEMHALKHKKNRFFVPQVVHFYSICKYERADIFCHFLNKQFEIWSVVYIEWTLGYILWSVWQPITFDLFNLWDYFLSFHFERIFESFSLMRSWNWTLDIEYLVILLFKILFLMSYLRWKSIWDNFFLISYQTS